MDYDSLKAGPELDAMIEQIVLQLPETCNGPGCFHGSAYDVDGYWCEGGGADDDSKSFYDPHPRVPYDYSGCIAFAWRIVEKMYPRLGVEPYDLHPWVCHDGGGDVNRAKVIAYADTAALAICIAALKVVRESASV